MMTTTASHTALVRRLALLAILLGISLSATFSTVRYTGLEGRVAAQQAQVVLVNAASYANDAGAGVAPDSIAALYGQFITQGNQAYPLPAGTTTLPTTLGGVQVTIGGKPAPLFYVGTAQINLSVPADLPDGSTPILVTNSDGSTRNGTVLIVRVQPGVFTSLSTGTGTAAALTTKDGVSYNFVSNPDGSAKDLDAGTVQQPNYLVLFGTGLRLAGQANVKVTVQGVPAQVIYAGKVDQFVGLDQLNVIIPPELAGFGTVQVKVTAGAKTSNTVSIKLGGEVPSIRLNTLAEGQVVQQGDASGLSDEQIAAAFATVRARTRQVPPQFSAIRVDGERAHALARAGKEFVLPEREVEVPVFRVTGRDGCNIAFEAEVSKGTYIRSLGRDVGRELGCFGHLTALRRTRVGRFSVERAATIAVLAERGVEGS
ncbi:MAG: hypothetical protein ACKOB4_18025, partial [Acidobacteriota bacterium]